MTVPTVSPARARRRSWPGWLGVALVLAAMAPAAALAQSGSATVELGLGGHIVADAWNPVQVTLRDSGPSILRLRIDEGSLLEGPRIVRYSASVPGGSGVRVFDDDVFVPSFRTLSWTLAGADGVLASGSLGPQASDSRRLQVVLSSAPGRWRAAFAADARLADVPPSELPARAAAYDGVATVLIDGTAAAPRTESVAAAAAGGAQVLLAGALPRSQAGLDLLAGRGRERLGAGMVARVPADPKAVANARAAWTPQRRAAMVNALAADRLVQPPRTPRQPLDLSLAAAYVLVALLALRFGGAPGLVAGLALAVLVSLAGWRLLRPPSPVLSASRTVVLGGGELALALGVDERLTLPAGVVTVPVPTRPLPAIPYGVVDGVTRVDLARWHAVTLARRPQLRTAALRFEGGALANVGRERLRNVIVLGLGRQRDLAPGASLRPVPGEQGPLPAPLAALSKLLPAGTALAEAPQTVWVALPSLAPETGSAP